MRGLGVHINLPPIGILQLLHCKNSLLIPLRLAIKITKIMDLHADYRHQSHKTATQTTASSGLEPHPPLTEPDRGPVAQAREDQQKQCG